MVKKGVEISDSNSSFHHKALLTSVFIIGLIVVFVVGAQFSDVFTGKVTATKGDLQVNSVPTGSRYSAIVTKCSNVFFNTCSVLPNSGFVDTAPGPNQGQIISRRTPFRLMNLDPGFYRVRYYYNFIPGTTETAWDSVGIKNVYVAANKISTVTYTYAANCYDGIKNHGELAVDCGGPCQRQCTLQELS